MSFDDTPDLCSVLIPIKITESMITSSTVTPEDPNPAWASGTTYAGGDRVYSAATHLVYESLKDNNTDKDPTLPANQTNISGVGTWWAVVGPTNRFAMFDGIVSTQSSVATPLTVVLRPGYFNSLALFGIDADDITVTVKDAPGGTVIFSYSAPLEGSEPADYYEYFYDPFMPQTQINITGIVPYNNAELTVTLTKGAGTVKLGMLAIGDLMPVGLPLRGATVDIVDYSAIVVDAYGNTTIKKRVNATGLTITAKCTIEEANAVIAGLKSTLGTPVVVIGSTAVMYEALTAFGLLTVRPVYGDFGYVDMNITVRGMI